MLPPTQGTTHNTAGCALPGSQLLVLPGEHVLLQTTQTPSLSQRVPATQKIKNHPATIRGGPKLNGQSKVPPCVFTGGGLHHSPTVVAGSSMDRICTGTKGKASGVRHTTGADRTTKKARRADEATAIAISHRPPEMPGALANFRVSQKANSMKTCTSIGYPMKSWTSVRTLSTNSTKTSTRNAILRTTAKPETKTGKRGRRLSLPETNSMAGRTCVRNDVEKMTDRGSQRPNNPNP